MFLNISYFQHTVKIFPIFIFAVTGRGRKHGFIKISMYLSLFLGLDHNHKKNTACILLTRVLDIWKQKELLKTSLLLCISHRNVCFLFQVGHRMGSLLESITFVIFRRQENDEHELQD